MRIAAFVAPSGEMALEVADDGIGMSQREITIALAPFGQVDSKLSRAYEGTGLGLPLTKALLELHDGRLTIDSTSGTGTTVRALLPAARVLAPGAKDITRS